MKKSLTRNACLVLAATAFLSMSLAGPAQAATEQEAVTYMDTAATEQDFAAIQARSDAPETPAEGDGFLSPGGTNADSQTMSAQGTNGTGQSWYVKCTGEGTSKGVNDPHYSSGAGGAIYKTVIRCTGNGVTSVNLKVNGLLRYGASSCSNTKNVKWVNRATSTQTQAITVNGGAVTFYTPLVGGNGGRGSGYWSATSTWQYVKLGVTSTVGTGNKLVCKTI